MTCLSSPLLHEHTSTCLPLVQQVLVREVLLLYIQSSSFSSCIIRRIMTVGDSVQGWKQATSTNFNTQTHFAGDQARSSVDTATAEVCEYSLKHKRAARTCCHSTAPRELCTAHCSVDRSETPPPPVRSPGGQPPGSGCRARSTSA